MNVATYKQANRTMWAAGNDDAVAELVWSAGERLVGRVGVQVGQDVLDVACGTGNATIPAAEAGASVVGLDLTPELFARARERADEAGVAIDWVEGDAESLPFPDASFDVVLSTFGCQFAPRHDVTAGELARVLRPDGRLGVVAWTPEGFVGDFFRSLGAHLPPPPDFAAPPVLWGRSGPCPRALRGHRRRARLRARPGRFPLRFGRARGRLLRGELRAGDHDSRAPRSRGTLGRRPRGLRRGIRGPRRGRRVARVSGRVPRHPRQEEVGRPRRWTAHDLSGDSSRSPVPAKTRPLRPPGGGGRLAAQALRHRRERPGAATRLRRGHARPCRVGPPQPPVADDRYGAAFATAHDARSIGIALIYWWQSENELHQRIYVSPKDDPTAFTRVDDQPAGCVWELAIVDFERRAWIEDILSNPSGADLERYLGRRLDADV